MEYTMDGATYTYLPRLEDEQYKDFMRNCVLVKWRRLRRSRLLFMQPP